VPLELPEPADKPGLVENMMKALSQGDMKAVAKTLSEDVVWHDDGDSLPPFEGRKDVLARLNLFRKICSDGRLQPRLMLEDAIAVTYVYRGSHDGWLAGVEDTGKTIGLEGIAFFKINEMEIVEVVNFFNPLTLMAQVGVTDEEAPPVPELPEAPVKLLSDRDSPTHLQERLQAAFKALGEGDEGPLAAVLSADVIYHDHLALMVTSGVKDVLRSLAGFKGEFSDVKVEFVEVHQVREYVVVRVKWTGVHAGGPERPWAAGKRPNCRRADLYRFDDGKVVEVRSFGNPLHIIYQLDLQS